MISRRAGARSAARRRWIIHDPNIANASRRRGHARHIHTPARWRPSAFAALLLATACSTTPEQPVLLDSADCSIDPPRYVRAIGNWVHRGSDPAWLPDVCDGTWVPRITEVLPRAQVQELLDKSLSVDCQPLPEQTGQLQLVLSCGGTAHANEPFATYQIADTELQLGVQRTGNGDGGMGSIEILVVEVEDPWTITSVVDLGTCTDLDLPYLDGICK